MDDLRASNLIAEIQVAGNPDWQASGFGALWVATGSGASVERIDTTKNTVVASVAVDDPCLDLAVGFGSIWSPSCADDAVDRIDPVTERVVARIAIPGLPTDGEGQLVAALGSVWLFVDDAGSLVRIDPQTDRVAATYHVGDGGVSVVATTDALWAAEPGDSDVLQISPAGKVLRTIDVAQTPRFETAGEGAIWVLGQSDGNVTRIDPASGVVVATIAADLAGTGGCVASGGGFVWATLDGTPVTKIDAKTNRVVAQYFGDGGDCISYADGSVWLSNNGAGTVWRLRP